MRLFLEVNLRPVCKGPKRFNGIHADGKKHCKECGHHHCKFCIGCIRCGHGLKIPA